MLATCRDVRVGLLVHIFFFLKKNGITRETAEGNDFIRVYFSLSGIQHKAQTSLFRAAAAFSFLWKKMHSWVW